MSYPSMIIALASVAASLRGTAALHLGAHNGSDASSSGGAAAHNASNASADAVQCMEGASTAGSTAAALPAAPAAFVKHPTGLTFRTYILDGRPKYHQAQRLRSGTWEQSAQKFMEGAFRSDPNCSRPIFIDGGAAFGFYSLLAAFHNPCREVQAFNPHPKFAAAMQHNIDDNVKSGVLGAPKICINKLALARAEGMTEIDFGYGKGIRKKSKSFVARTPVKMTSLDAWAGQHLPDGKQILMVKLDVEGQELKVLQGATKLLQGCRVKFWSIGIHQGVKVETVADILKKNGYTIDSSSGTGRGQPNGEILAHC